MQPTPQQQAIFDEVAGGSAHVIAEAVAGAGKSTTAVGAAKRARGRVGFVAFNKHIATELQAKLGASARACTLHSLGFAAVRRTFLGVELDEQKPKKLLATLRPEWFFQGRRGLVGNENAQAALELARLCKLTLADETEPQNLLNLADVYGVELPDDPDAVYQATRELVAACARETDTVDFDDMVWLPVRLKLRPEPHDLLMVDELQDLSRVTQELALAAVDGGRLVGIGDSKQAIMGFAGADTESMARLTEQLTWNPRGCRTLPLTCTFRCPTSHVALAKKIVPWIEAAPGAAEGTVTEAGMDQVKPTLAAGDMVICRKNAPLVGLAYSLIAAGRPALMRGREIGKGLLDLIDRMQAADTKKLAQKLADYHDREEKRLAGRDAPASAFAALEDKVGCLAYIASQFDTVSQLRGFVQQLFSDESPAGKVVLSSIHRAKGLEAERVVIVEPESIPLVFRKDGAVTSRPWEVEQEHNLAYVAVTRAKKELVFAGPMPEILR